MMDIYNGKFCVYIHTNLINGKIYVGQTCQNPKVRWANGSTYKGSVYFYKAIQKYGWENFDHEVIASKLTQDEANHFEELLIEKLDTMNPKKGYNLKSGGENNLLSDSIKQKISNAAKCRIGDKNSFFNKHHSEETKEKIRRKNKANFIKENNPMYGVHRYGENAPMYGKSHTDETKIKMSKNNSGANNPMAKKFNQYGIDGIFIKTWECAKYAENELNIRAQNIIRCAKGIRPTAGGFVWYYANDLTQPDKTKVVSITQQNDLKLRRK